jgi:hypothetical protein
MIDHLSLRDTGVLLKALGVDLSRTVMAQVLIALHLVGSSGSERDRINLNIYQGSTRNDTWKLIDLLVSVANRYSCHPCSAMHLI